MENVEKIKYLERSQACESKVEKRAKEVSPISVNKVRRHV